MIILPVYLEWASKNLAGNDIEKVKTETLCFNSMQFFIRALLCELSRHMAVKFETLCFSGNLSYLARTSFGRGYPLSGAARLSPNICLITKNLIIFLFAKSMI